MQVPSVEQAVISTTEMEVRRPLKPNRLSEALPSIQKESRFGEEADRYMSFWGNLFATFALALIGLIGGLIWSWVFHYRLIERQNQHFARQRRFYGLIAGALMKQGEESSNRELIATAELIQGLLNEAGAGEPQRNPWLWGVILPGLFGIPMFYTYWFLMNDLSKHSLRQIQVTEAVIQGLRITTGENTSIGDTSIVPHRNYWMYLLLSPLLLISVFVLLYRIFDDPNKHFIQQRGVEDEILSCLSRASVAA